MAQSAEERKIKRLEAQVKRLKVQIEEQDKMLRWKESALYGEREWRRSFQKLLKEVVLDDTVDELHDSLYRESY
jgi:hypothetical protein